MKEQKLNAYGMTPLTGKHYFVYGLGNFASQLSWTMVSTYLSIFYTDVFGLGVGAVALLMLIAKVWDGINDPMMGTLMERTHTRWGRFRPYIFVGAIFLVIFTILTFTVPGFGGPAKLAYAYITYIGLGMSYTMTNVPYLASVPILFLLLQIKFLCHIVYRACDIHHSEDQRYGKCTDDHSVYKSCNLLWV